MYDMSGFCNGVLVQVLMCKQKWQLIQAQLGALRMLPTAMQVSHGYCTCIIVCLRKVICLRCVTWAVGWVWGDFQLCMLLETAAYTKQ
jgi:hypothetical protein